MAGRREAKKTAGDPQKREILKFLHHESTVLFTAPKYPAFRYLPRKDGAFFLWHADSIFFICKINQNFAPAASLLLLSQALPYGKGTKPMAVL